MNRTSMWSLLCSALWLAASPSVAAQVSGREHVELTVYNQDFALVKEQRKLTLEQGINQVNLEEVAAQIDPTSVHFVSLTAPDKVRILEQNYEFDLVNYGKLLEKYVGQEIEIHELVDQESGEVRIRKATLLSSGFAPQPVPMGYGLRPVYQYANYGQPLFEIDGKIHAGVNGQIVLPALPGGLILKPTLSWHIDSGKAGAHTAELSYMTSGIKWVADYVALVNANDSRLNLTGWVTLDNRSGTSYQEAKLKLMAGDVNVITPQVYGGYDKNADMAYAGAREEPQFQEKSFFEYHLYTLQRPTTIKDSEIKQIEFTSASEVPVAKRYVYDGFAEAQYRGWDASSMRERQDFGNASQSKVWVTLEFKNSEDHRMGMPLPKGRVRLYKLDPDGGQEFVGEDLIDHTPKDEAVRLYAGNAFDLVGERKQLDFKVIESGHIVDETFDITLRNHKAEDTVIVVKEHLYRGKEWEIRGSSHAFTKTDAQTMECPVTVPKDGQVKVTYTVRYRW